MTSFWRNVKRWADHSPTTLPFLRWSKPIQTRVSESSCSMFLPFTYYIWICISALTDWRRVADTTDFSRCFNPNVAHAWVGLPPASPHYDVPSWIYRLTSIVTHGLRLTTKHGCFFLLICQSTVSSPAQRWQMSLFQDVSNWWFIVSRTVTV